MLVLLKGAGTEVDADTVKVLTENGKVSEESGVPWTSSVKEAPSPDFSLLRTLSSHIICRNGRVHSFRGLETL